MQRLKSESSEVGDQRSDVSYSYDAVGNRLSKTVDGITVNYNHPYGTSGNRLSSWTATSTNNFESLRTISVAGHSSEEIGTNDMFGVLWVSNTVAVTPDVDGTNFSVNSFVVGSGTQEIVAAIRDEAGNVGYATNTITTRIVTNAAYSYSDAGCLTNITYTGISYPKTTTSLKWNSQYQLTSVSTNGALVESYQYDSSGRRTCSVRSQSGISTTNYYIYDGIQCVADTDSSGNLLRSYTWGPGVDNLLAMTVYTGSVVRTYYAMTDHLGTVHALTDSSGNIVESYKYDAWGRVLGVYDNGGNPLTSDLGSPISVIGNRYLWQGREYSRSTGLYNFRARWYDPVTGRWLSKDPIGISGGLNQYVFCNNNGVNFVDPLGHNAYVIRIGNKFTGHRFLAVDNPSGGMIAYHFYARGHHAGASLWSYAKAFVYDRVDMWSEVIQDPQSYLLYNVRAGTEIAVEAIALGTSVDDTQMIQKMNNKCNIENKNGHYSIFGDRDCNTVTWQSFRSYAGFGETVEINYMNIPSESILNMISMPNFAWVTRNYKLDK